MCSQLIQNVNISFEIYANVSMGVWTSSGGTAWGQRGGSGEGSGKVRGRFGEGSGKVRGGSGEATGEPAPDPPVDISMGLL